MIRNSTTHQRPIRTGPVRAALAGALAALGAAPASGQTITVTTLHDVTDFALPRTVAQLPGPDGKVSMREACLAVSNTPGPQTIEFAIPTSEWWLIMDVALLRVGFDAFVITDDETTIDFTSQTRFTGDTNPDGNEVAIYGVHPGGAGTAAIYILADNCVIRGLDEVHQRMYGVEIHGNNNRVVGSTISGATAVHITGGWGGPPASGNIIGGTAPEDGNIFGSGIRIGGPANENVVIGNQVHGGVLVYGDTAFGPAIGNRIGGPTPAERNVIAGAGRYGEEGFPIGSQVAIEGARDTIVEGNYVGTTPDGLARHSPQVGPTGIAVLDSVNTTVRNNVIGGIRVQGTRHYAGIWFGRGIHVTALNDKAIPENTVIEGNIIGAGADGVTPIPNLYGIEAGRVTFVPLAADALVAGNLITHNERSGVLVDWMISGVRLAGNTIAGNGELGIDLIPEFGSRGVTANDPGDADTGGNGLQNFPVLDSARAESGMQIEGSLSSRPSRAYTVEFFASSACDPSGHGEGEEFLGSTMVTTDGAGIARFAASVAMPTGGRMSITATATDDATGETSEFSACIEASGAGCYADCDGSGSLDFFDFLCFQNQFAAGDPQADCDDSGKLDFFDFLCFQTHFAAGCP